MVDISAKCSKLDNVTSCRYYYKYIVNENDWHVREDLPTEADDSGNRNNVLTSPEAEHAATDSDKAEKTTGELRDYLLSP